MAAVKGEKHATIIQETTATEEGIFKRRQGRGGMCGGALNIESGIDSKRENKTKNNTSWAETAAN